MLVIANAEEADVPALAALLEEVDRFYGVTEFVIQDPDGYLITFGEHGDHV